MIPELDPVEVRVLGALIEKEITTPEYYPLTMNALVNACNQKSNREPVVSWDEDTVAEAIDGLRHKRLAGSLTGGSNRVPKYNHRLGESLNLGRRETAVLCELLLRGPQTVGELRDRAGRMHRFSDLDEVEGLLRQMGERGFVAQLPKQPGHKEVRFAHLLSGEPVLSPEPIGVVPHASTSSVAGGFAELSAELERLKLRVQELEQQWTQFRQQFE